MTRAVSYGGGVQSTALLVLAAQGIIDFDLFLFANTGDDSEAEETLDYVRRHAKPYAATHGIDLVELHREGDTLLERINAGQNVIPIRYQNGMPGRRICTGDFKIKVVAKELKRLGATAANPAVLALGISTDEIQRAKPGTDPGMRAQTRTYPLLDLGYARHHCEQIIIIAGLPVPPKSACWFCPYHGTEAWRSLKRRRPDKFEEAAQLEEFMSARSQAAGDGPVWMTDKLRPLRDVVDDQEQLPGLGDDCDSGFCFT